MQSTRVRSRICCAPICCRRPTSPRRQLRDLRDLLRHRVALTRIRSALKQRVGAILANHGIARPYSNLFGVGGSRFLAELEPREGPRRRLDSLLAPIAAFDRELETTTKEIERRASADPYVEVLCQIRWRRPLHRHAR